MTENTQKKGTVLQAVKAIAVLVVICLVCGALLALCNDVFFISDAERERRAEAKINKSLTEVYPDFVEDTGFNGKTINKEYGVNSSFGSVQKVVKSTDGTFILASVGHGGYGGDITVLIAIDKDAKIVGWKISDKGGETYAGDVEQHTDWYIGEQISTDIALRKHGGATLTSTALNNAVKMASYYAMNVLNLGSNPEKDARDTIAALLEGTDYADYELTVNLDTEYREACAVGDNVLSYYFEGTKEGADPIVAYVFNVETDPKAVIVKDGLTYADRHKADAIVKVSDGIADELVASVQDRSYLEYVAQKSYADFKLASIVKLDASLANGNDGTVNSVYVSEDGAVLVNATGKGGFADGTVTINTVIKDGAIVAWSIISHDSQSFLGQLLDDWDDNVKNWYVGDSIDAPISLGDSNTFTGVTMSSTAINNAINVSCNYVKNAIQQGGGD